MRDRILAPLSLAALALACQPAPAGPAHDPVADEAAVRAVQATEVASVNGGMNDLSYFAQDAVILPPNEPAVSGVDAIRAWGETFFSEYSADVTYTASDILVSGDLAVEVYGGTLVLTPKAGGDAMTETLKGLHVYRRQADGSWKMTHDMWSTNTAPPM